MDCKHKWMETSYKYSQCVFCGRLLGNQDGKIYSNVEEAYQIQKPSGLKHFLITVGLVMGTNFIILADLLPVIGDIALVSSLGLWVIYLIIKNRIRS